MARHSIINGVRVDFTPEQEAERDTEEERVAAALPMDLWLRDMCGTDAVSRMQEDLYDGMDAESQARVSQITRDKIAAKKTLRSEKPEQ